MDEKEHQFETDGNRVCNQRTALLAILLCATVFVFYKLQVTAKILATREENLYGKMVEIDDPMIPLEVDLIPWQTDDSTNQAASHTVTNRESRPIGRVLIVRGILTIFSLGMDDLAKKMRDAGYEVKVTTAAQSGYEARVLRDHVLATGSNKPIIIIGHSLGGDKAPGLATIFAEKNVPVDVLFMLDSTMPSSPPKNVKVCVNMYQDNGTPDWARIFRGTRIDSKHPQTRLINVDIRELADRDTTSRIHHFNIDANPWIHKVVIKMVGQLLPSTHFEKTTLLTNVDADGSRKPETRPNRVNRIPVQNRIGARQQPRRH